MMSIKKENAQRLAGTVAKTRIAIFASGAGSNAQRIIDHFRENEKAGISLIVCNNPDAGVLHIAAAENIPVLPVERKIFSQTGYVAQLKDRRIGFIVLAGFLWKVPEPLIRAFPQKIINIHPALLPDFGGKGMYGMAVHAAVIAAGRKESGITIHYVDEKYDHGTVIFQARCPVEPGDTPGSLARKIHALEHRYYPAEIDSLTRHLE